MEMGKSRGGKGAPADFRYSLQNSPSQILDLQRKWLLGRKGRTEGGEKKGEGRDRNGGVA